MAQGSSLVEGVTMPSGSGDAQGGRATVVRPAIAALTASVAALTPAMQTQPPVVGGAGATMRRQFSGVLTLREAIQRGLAYNLTVVGMANAIGQARGQQRTARSALMPNVSGDFSANEQQVNLSAMGVRIEIPGTTVPDLVRFNVVDLHARLSQTIVNLNGLNNYRAARETVQANELSLEDSRDLIVLTVGGAYLEALAARARLQSTRAQIDTATAIHERAVQQRGAGLATPIDVNRALVQTLTAQQRLAGLDADFAKRKINLSRLIGMPPTDQYDLGPDVPFAAAPARTVDEAVKQAIEGRSDVKASEAQVRAAERTLAAAQASRLPSVTLNGEYGGNRASGKPAHPVFSIGGTVRVPIWEGGRAAGAIEQATFALSQRRAELDDLKGQIEADVRKAYLDLRAAAGQVETSQTSLQLTRDTLAMTRQRFDAGVGDNISVIQSQESVAAAEFDYINSVFSHNLAKLGLARNVGRASEDVAQYLQQP
jgi:outer membrane protein TolC